MRRKTTTIERRLVSPGSRRRHTTLAVVLVLAASGCATVDPSGDYERARSIVHDATGQAALFSPDEEEKARQAAILGKEGGA